MPRDSFADFFRGYVTCALWSSTDNSREDGGDPLDKNYDREDIAPETLARMASDCRAFFDANLADLETYVFEIRHNPNEGSPFDYAGHDFWLTRNGHGAGFWDRGLGELGERLTKACKPFRTVDLYVGDDGKIYS